MFEAFKKNPFLSATILLGILCFITYAPILSHHFMIDDFYFLDQENNPYNYFHFADFFTKNTSTHYAPLNFFLNTSLFNLSNNPIVFYLINLTVFYTNALLLFFFVFLISKNPFVALLTSISFCIHPMTGEVLQHITLNIILIHTLLMLLGLITLYQYAQKKIFFYYTASIGFVFIALFCQEITLFFPFYAATLLFFCTKDNLKNILKTTLPFILFNLLFIGTWLFLANHNAHLVQNLSFFHLNIWEWSANFFRLMSWYIGNLIFPHNILFEYNITPIKDHIWLWNLGFLGFLSGYAFLIFCYLKRSLESFALVIFFIGFLYAIPGSLAHSDMGLVFEPFWLYFSSIGFYLFISLMLLRVKRKIHLWSWIFLLSSLFIFLFIKTQELNNLAKNELSYSENWLRKSPNNTYAMRILARIYCYEQKDIPSDLIPSMFNMLDIFINSNLPRNASKLIEKLSSSPLTYNQKKDLFFKSTAFYCKDPHNNQCQNAIKNVLSSASTPDKHL